MRGTFRFSYMGLLFLLMLIIPNLIWTKHHPTGYDPHGENKVLLAFERVGQALITCSALLFSNFNLRPWSPWSLWMVAAFLLLGIYGRVI